MLKNKKAVSAITVLFVLCVLCFTIWGILTFRQVKMENNTNADIVIEDDFTKTSFIEGKSGVDNSHVYENKGVSSPKGFAEEGYGLIPCENFSHDLYRPDDGYIVYKVETHDGRVFQTLKLDLKTYVTHCDNVAYIGKDKTNIKISVATKESAFRSAGAICPTGGGGEYTAFTGDLTTRLNSAKDTSFDLTSYVIGKTIAYIKIELLHLTYEEIAEKTTSGVDSFIDATNGFVKRLGVSLYNVKIAADEETNATQSVKSTVGEFVIEDNFCNLAEGVSAWKQRREVNGLTTYDYGNAVYGIVPANSWGATIDTANGYVVYQIPLNGNGIINTLEDLKLEIGAVLNGQYYHGAIVVSYGYDGGNYTELFRASTNGVYSETKKEYNCDFKQVISSEQAKNAKTLYVKISIEHDTATEVMLYKVAARLLKIKFIGQRAFAMEKGASVRLDKVGNSLKFTTIVDKDLYYSLSSAGYELLFGTIVMPYDYISTYGELTVENLFTENAKYCWGTAVQGKTLILNGTATLDGNYNNEYSYTYSLLNISSDDVNKKFIAKSYLRLKKDGVEKFIFAEYAQEDIQNNVVSVSSAAQNTMETAVGDDVYSLRNEYLNKIKGQMVTYTVKHIYLSGNDIVATATTTHTAEAGTVISAPETARAGYTATDSATTTVGTYSSYVTGTVLADGSLVFVRYYLNNV